MTSGSVTIVGCGLIGGSMGMALKRRRPEMELTCLDVSENLPAISAAGFADRVGVLDNAEDILSGSELVILAMPVEVILEQLEIIAPHLKMGAVVTDVGGTKVEIAAEAERVLPDGVHFIGGHPIAGSENSGVQAADPLLFKGNVYVLCPNPDTPAPALIKLIDLVEDLMALPLTIEPEEHDRILAMVSHVPQLLSIALVHAALEEDSFHSLLDVTVGRGFLDLTRIAASRFEPWKGVLKTNRRSISDALDRLEESLSAVRKSLEDDDLSELWTQVSARRRKMTPEILLRKRKPDLRLLIDQHDERILKALSDRMRSVRQMGELKADQDAPVYDPGRERRLLNARREWGRALGIPSDLIDELFEVIVRHSRNMQSR
ncbi:MAG: prephenate dehydrogenase/arogenate dehydrogenase family protein [Deltaproteobacteria bacterium]|nr:prephenate dehydrogenase/arogenate dehydrogenase family protein [Deltaproteobacteria bacterium]